MVGDSNSVVMFSNDQFGSIRIEQEGEQLWFVASDVARALGYEKTNSMNKLIGADEDEEG